MDYLKSYVDFLKSKVKLAETVSVVFDCSNGTTGKVLEKLFSIKYSVSGIKYVLINEKPDGNFPAHGPNPLAEGAIGDLQKTVVKNKADFGAIFDADGDRAFFVDDLGRVVPADAILYLLSKNFHGPVVTNILAGYLAADLFKKAKKKLIESRVGHYFIKNTMKVKKADFGGEFSGHYYFPLGASYFDSGILAAIYLMNAVAEMKAAGQRLSGWLDGLPVFYRSGELNFEVKDKEGVMAMIEKKYSSVAERVSKIDGLKMEFGPPAGGWWFALRPSNTENLLRLVMEAQDKKVLDRRLAELKKLIWFYGLF